MAEWVDIVISCPHCGKGDSRYWYHADCDGKLALNAECQIRCLKCYTTHLITVWAWNCGGNHGYEKATKEHVKAVFGTLVSTLKATGNKAAAKVVALAIVKLVDLDF